MNAPLYLDYNATTPLRPQARAAMLDAFDHVGNASSVHGFGRLARKCVEEAREHVAALVGARARDVVFTGSGTEANNQILKAWPDRHLFTSAIEHDSVRDVARDRQTLLPVTAQGQLDVSQAVSMIAAHRAPCVVALMGVNNETGIIQPVQHLSLALEALQRPDIHLHCDAVQAAGKMWLDMSVWGVDSLSLSAHKIGGPQGVGALVHRAGLDVPRFVDGGGQERRLRAGTENVAGIAGFGAAAQASLSALSDGECAAQLVHWRQQLVDCIADANPNAVFLSENMGAQLGTTVNVAVPGLRAETLVMKADLAGVAISAGSACSSGKVNQSPVALAMGYSTAVAQGSVRLSIGWATTQSEIDQALERLKKIFKPRP